MPTLVYTELHVYMRLPTHITGLWVTQLISRLISDDAHAYPNNYSVGVVGGLCEGPRWSGGGGGRTDVNTYISLHIPQRSLLLHLSYTDHIHTEDSKLPHSKPTFRPYLLVTLN